VTHVLIARMDNDGDVLLSGPAVRAVAARAGRVTYLCGPRGHAAAELLPGVDEILRHHCPWIDAHPEPVVPGAMSALVAAVASRRLDEAIVLTSFHQSALPLALLLRLAGVPRIAATSIDYPGSLLDVRHREPDDGGAPRHEVERGLDLAAAAGFRLRPGDDGLLHVREPLPPAPLPAPTRPYVVLHPGTSASARAWPAARWRDLAVLVARDLDVVVTGGPDEVGLTAFVAGDVATDLGGATSFGELAAVLAGAATTVVGNTGPAHLAAAVGTPTVSLFAPTVPASGWAPYGVPNVVLGDQHAPCAGTGALTCPVPGHPCLTSVTVDEVAGAVAALGTVVSA
jgi:ADP-heptose:LPS heptosyltransferase